MNPSSRIECDAGELPDAVEHGDAGGRGWWNTSASEAGRIAVTPVRATGSSDQHVTWPTSTPGTSVIAFSGPAGSSPTSTPRSRGRGRGGGGPLTTAS